MVMDSALKKLHPIEYENDVAIRSHTVAQDCHDDSTGECTTDGRADREGHHNAVKYTEITERDKPKS